MERHITSEEYQDIAQYHQNIMIDRVHGSIMFARWISTKASIVDSYVHCCGVCIGLQQLTMYSVLIFSKQHHYIEPQLLRFMSVDMLSNCCRRHRI